MTVEGKSEQVAHIKRQYLQSAKFTANEQDLLRAVLKEDQAYTHDQVRKLVNNYLKRKVT